jgi:hypothetical protein
VGLHRRQMNSDLMKLNAISSIFVHPYTGNDASHDAQASNYSLRPLNDNISLYFNRFRLLLQDLPRMFQSHVINGIKTFKVEHTELS